VPFHLALLLNGHGDYENQSLDDRRRLLVRFATFVRLVPIHCETLAYRKKEVPPDLLVTKLKQDLVNYLFSNLAFFQGFDAVKVHYDRGQGLVTRNLKAVIGYALGKSAAEVRRERP
jgi:hypothetical protein